MQAGGFSFKYWTRGVLPGVLLAGGLSACGDLATLPPSAGMGANPTLLSAQVPPLIPPATGPSGSNLFWKIPAGRFPAPLQ